MFLFQSKEEVEEQSRAERWQVGRHRREEERKRLGRQLGERWLVKQSRLWRGSSSVISLFLLLKSHLTYICI